MTTPEQLSKWREEFENGLQSYPHITKPVDKRLLAYQQECEWQGYLRRCQETEQALKDERKQTLEKALAICNGALSFPDSKYYISDKLKELLND